MPEGAYVPGVVAGGWGEGLIERPASMSSSPISKVHNDFQLFPDAIAPPRRQRKVDGPVVWIEECRRQGRSTTTRHQQHSVLRKSSHTANEPTAKPPAGFLRLSDLCVELEGLPVEELRKLDRSRAAKPSGPVVLHQARGGTTTEQTTSKPCDSKCLSPPPTPRIGRLPTPDIELLDDTPYCDCCAKGGIRKFCTNCGSLLIM